MGALQKRGQVFLVAGLLALAACNSAPVPPGPGPDTDPDINPGPIVASPQSQKLTRYYGRLQNSLLTQGLLRTGGGGIDTPYTDTDLLRNFEQIAFYDEYAEDGGFKRSDGKSRALRKWTRPVRVKIEFGASVPEAQRTTDTALVNGYITRLASITGHPITPTNRNANFHVLIMGEDDRPQALDLIQKVAPGLSPTSLAVFRNLPRSTHCLVAAFATPDNSQDYVRAIAFIRAEHPSILRQSCVHEEIAQGLGLVNDSPRARPSIFNDDDEFALLTTHDEELLRLLYNSDLSAGMSADQARPILQRLVLGQPGPS